MGAGRIPAAAVSALVLLAVLFASGCGTPTVEYNLRRGSARTAGRYRIKPTVAVTAFENRAGFNGKWQLGEGMADLLIDDLLATRQVVVLDRRHLDDVIGELLRQGKDLFRREGRVETGRLKNARYIIRGTVTDFTVTGDSSGWFGMPHIKAHGRGTRARVALSLTVADVASGEVVAAVKTEAAASSGLFGAGVNYRKVAFGGETFFRTPLGRATEKAIHKAVRRILSRLPPQYWQARIASAEGDQVIVNGGANVKLRPGEEFLVRGAGREITDPITGDVIERIPGRVVGRIRIREVGECASYADLVEGTARRGYYLEPVD